MYRQGHGDCFLIAFPRQGGGDPYYVLIDCGYKPGSNSDRYFTKARSIDEIVDHLHASCQGHLDLVILTHEHQDHLNGLWGGGKNPRFSDFEIEEAWLAWTEDPHNDLANELRRRHRDQLIGLVGARHQLQLAAGDEDPAVRRLDALLSLELGDGDTELTIPDLFAAATDPTRSGNKQALKLVKDKAAANKGCSYLTPGVEPIPLRGAAGIRAFVLGPPANPDLIADEDPHDGEGFPQANSFSFTAAGRAASLDLAVSAPESRRPPFRRPFWAPLEFAFDVETTFFLNRYGQSETDDDRDRIEVPTNAPWRRIDNEWLYSAETLALKLNTGVNNTSLVVAFELPNSKKVLFFAADAQRGNWMSWKDVAWADGGTTVTTRDLLARTVLYKVGHHGSHNATLSGKQTDDHPNLSWMGHGTAAEEFTAMITAVNEWALQNRPPWVHPLPSIKDALLRKACGRVLQMDEDTLEKPDDVADGEWARFTARTSLQELYFDWQVDDR
jgi:beta-lactamase superfamily II metal-dependent hydrolase